MRESLIALRREEQEWQESETRLRISNRIEQANWAMRNKEWHQLRVEIAENEVKRLEGKKVLDPNTLAELKQKEKQAKMQVAQSGTNELWQRVEAENNERRRKAGNEVRAQLNAEGTEGRSLSPEEFEYAVTRHLDKQDQMAWDRWMREKESGE